MIPLLLVGAGNRGMVYAKILREQDLPLQITGIVEPDEERRRYAADFCRVPEASCYASVEEAVAARHPAAAAVNCTMDKLHAETSLPLLEAGYDLLLEKPIACTEEEMEQIRDCAGKHHRKVMVCHVLRYAPFYRKIRELLADGILGTILNVQMGEQVSFYHESVSYLRGFYADPAVCGSGMLLSKCSHDLDLMTWLMGKNKVRKVRSFGSVQQFLPGQAPEGAGTVCMLDCPLADTCPYSAKVLYLEHPQRWVQRVWYDCGLTVHSPIEERAAALKDPKNRYGRCVYRLNLQIVDHQSVLVSFEDGATGTFNLNGGAARFGRSVHLTGTKGEICGRFEDQGFWIYRVDPASPDGCRKEYVDLSEKQQGEVHGGGDAGILRDFAALLAGEAVSICCTTLEDSLEGHRLVFQAEKDRLRPEKADW